ncbi:MAG: hypothetical protein GY703_04915 [Gammaproteobacteria bacterium]|nr:hypothetical protein [Gammaproteobacteria bacterium]
MVTLTEIMQPRYWGYRLGILLLMLACGSLVQAGAPVIKEVKYEDGDEQLVVKVVRAGRRAWVTVTNSASGDELGRVRANKKGKLEAKLDIPDDLPVPCSISATTSGGTNSKKVSEAPGNCDEMNDDNGSPGSGSTHHQNLTYNGPATCLECHSEQVNHVFDSTHYQLKGSAWYMSNQPGTQQGKHAGAVNTYCGNILGNWDGCSTCHIGRGAEPEQTVSDAQLVNVDCLICHQEDYKRKKVGGVMQPDTDNMSISMDEAVQTVHKPTRMTCLQCHAKAGGGDAVKRGDLALATANTVDKNYDVHMATTGANLACQDCHVPENHRFPGKGSDLRPTDLDVVLDCNSSGCHSSNPHDSSDLNRHTVKVACQTCHIPVYGKNANDTAATEATETHRSWLIGSDHTDAPFHPTLTKSNNLKPVYRHWDGSSHNTLLYDHVIPGPNDTVETSTPNGSVNDENSKLYPFKYKTSDYPLRIEPGAETEGGYLIALDTMVYFAIGNQEYAADAAVMSGLKNMRDDPNNTMDDVVFDPNDDYIWVTTDTYQLLNHQVSPDDDALTCNQCHMNPNHIDLQSNLLGYAPLNGGNRATCANGCHNAEKAWEWSYGSVEEFREGHKHHKEKEVACAECHGFSR